MKVKLVNEWLGNPAGSILTIKDAYAITLVARGAAVEIQEEENKIKIQRRDKDKMISETINK